MAQNPTDKTKKLQVTLNVGNKVITSLCCVCCSIVALIAIAALIWEKWEFDSVLKNFLVLGVMCFICHASVVLYVVTDMFTIVWSILTTPYGQSVLDFMGVNLSM